MTQEEFLNKRRNKQFTIEDVESILNDLGYKFKRVKTYCKENDIWDREAVDKFRNDLLKELGKTYFAYIKFYTNSNKISPNNDEIYALVAGKTNSWKDDVHFKYENGLSAPEDVVFERKDKAKKWLKSNRDISKNYRWYHEKILIVWCSKLIEEKLDEKDDLIKLENLAYSIEDDIGGLLGLFSS